MNETRGAIYYVVHNRRYIEFAIRSVASLKRHMPQLPASIYTDLEIPAGHCFDIVEQLPPVPAAWRMNQVMPMLRADYDSFVLLDADTRICAPFWEVFELVEDSRVDLAATLVHDRPGREEMFRWLYEEAGVPDAFPFFSSVFVAAQRNSRTVAFLEEWERWYLRLAEAKSDSFAQNEPCMRVALFRCLDLRMMPLPRRYAFGRHGILTRAATVIHWKGKGEEMKQIERAINAGAGHTRVIYRGKEKIRL